MRNDPTNPDPSPEQFAAFLDGELDSAARSRVESWLADRPTASAEIDGQRRVARLWADNPPPEPGPDAWAATLARIQARLPAAPRRPRRLPRTLWLSAGLAAAVLAAVVLTRLLQPDGPHNIHNRDKDDPLNVVRPSDVVGAPLAADAPIVLASQDDVSVMNVEPYWKDDGQVPEIGEGDVPMIVAPLIARSGREP